MKALYRSILKQMFGNFSWNLVVALDGFEAIEIEYKLLGFVDL